jgi:hypothetical protein
VSADEATKYAESNGMMYLEISFKTEETIIEAVGACFLEIETKLDAGEVSLAPKVEPMGFTVPGKESGSATARQEPRTEWQKSKMTQHSRVLFGINEED